MSGTNTGGSILICPTGDDVSTISSSDYAYIVANTAAGFGWHQTLSDELLGMWLSNVQRLRIDYLVIVDDVEFESDSDTISQWKIDGIGSPIEPNADGHPNPVNFLSGNIFGFAGLPAGVGSYFRDDGTPSPHDYAFPMKFFRYNGDFYWFMDTLYAVGGPGDSLNIEFDSDHLKIEYVIDGDSVSYDHVILETFYP